MVPLLCLTQVVTADELYGELSIAVSNVVSPTNPVATIVIYGHFDNTQATMLLGAWFDLSASEPGFVSNTTWVLYAGSLPSWSPITYPDYILGINPENFLLFDNPIKVASVKWITNDFTPREISLDTIISYIDLVPHSPTSGFHVKNPIEGFGTIQVIPAPSSALALFAGAGILTARRRRKQVN